MHINDIVIGDLVKCLGTDANSNVLIEHDKDITGKFTGHAHFFYGFWGLDKGFFSHHYITYSYGINGLNYNINEDAAVLR